MGFDVVLELDDREYTIVDILVLAKIVKSRSAAKRLIRQGAVKIYD